MKGYLGERPLLHHVRRDEKQTAKRAPCAKKE